MSRLADAPCVLVTARGFDCAAQALLEARGFAVRHPDLRNADPAPAALPGLLDNADAWIVGSTDVGRDLLARFPRLKVLARRGVGIERIDAGAAAELGRIVTIAAGATYEGLARTNRIAAETVAAILGGESPPPSCIVADGRCVNRRS